MGSLMLLIPILLPLTVGVLVMAVESLRTPRILRGELIATLIATLLLVLWVACSTDATLPLLCLTDRLALTLHVDTLGRLFTVLVATMFLLVGIYAPRYMAHERHQARFFTFYLIVLGLLIGLGYAANFITLYLFFELVTLCSLPLIGHTQTKEAIRAAFKFLYYSIAGAALALIGFFFVYHFSTSLDFTPGGVLDPALVAGHETTLLVAVFLTIVGFGAKAGMVPLHAWLPTAHPVAPAPASALLSGVITKVGIFSLIRFIFYLVGAEFIVGSWVQYAWIGLALVSILVGSALALREPLLKRRLAYSTISQVSYLMLGMAVLTATGFTGALLHMVFHSIAKDGLFLIAGAIILLTGKTLVSELGGIGRRLPLLMGCFAVLAVSVIGIPPLSGFVSKWFLASGSLESPLGALAWIGPVVLLASALLSAAYLLPIVIGAFFPSRDTAACHELEEGGHPCARALDAAEAGECSERSAVPASMTIPIVLLSIAALLFGLFPQWLIAVVSSLAERVL